jgi:CRISPR-associated protein Cmr4
MITRLALIHAMSPLHAGTGQSVGAIDLPIARERPTGIPLIPGSSIKGALRARSADSQWTRDVFGPDTTNASDHSGSVQFSDAHLLLLPVRSVRGTFAWVTSPFLIRRFARGAREAKLDLARLPGPPVDMEHCCVLTETKITMPGGKVVFEDLDFTVDPDSSNEALLRAFTVEVGNLLFPPDSPDFTDWRQSLLERICLIHDDVMSILLETATEVTAHIRLNNETKTVDKGALWYQESLPAESVLAGIVVAADVKAVNNRLDRKATELIQHVVSLTNGLVQLGGKATAGQGSCYVRIAGGRS